MTNYCGFFLIKSNFRPSFCNIKYSSVKSLPSPGAWFCQFPKKPGVFPFLATHEHPREHGVPLRHCIPFPALTTHLCIYPSGHLSPHCLVLNHIRWGKKAHQLEEGTTLTDTTFMEGWIIHSRSREREKGDQGETRWLRLLAVVICHSLPLFCF